MNNREHLEALKTFYKHSVWIFRGFCIWKLPNTTTPRYRILHNFVFGFILIVFVISFNVCCFIQLLMNITDLNEVIKVLFMFVTCLAMFVKFCTIKWNNHLYYELIEILRRPIFRPTNEREIVLFIKSQSLCCNMKYVFWRLAFCSLHAVLVPQIFLDSTQLPISVYNPINLNRRWRYWIMYLYQYISVSSCCYVNLAFDSLSASIFIHIKGQLDILCDRLEHLGKDISNSLHNEQINMKLKDCLKFYNEIEKFVRSVEYLVSFPISIQIACSTLVLMSNFYAMSFLSDPGDYVNFIKFAMYQMCMLSEIFILCYYSGEITYKSREISFSLYCSKWIDWNKLNRKLTLLMLYRFDFPIYIRSFIPTYTLSILTFSSIVNTSYSYFTLLKNFNS